MDAVWTTLARWGRRAAGARSGRPTPPDPAPAPVPERACDPAFVRRDRERPAAEAEAGAAVLLALLRELRAPLDTVSGFTQLLGLNARIDPLSPRQAVALGEMGRAMAEMTALIDDAAAFAEAHRTLPPPVLQRLDLRLAARQACDGLEGRAGAARVALVCAPPAAGLQALADPERLGVVLRRLIADAVRHTPPGGAVRIAVERDGDRIRTVVCEPGGAPGRTDVPAGLLDVVDGDGRLSPGLGLAAAQRLAESMGGVLGAAPRRRPEDGAAFILSLPAAPPRTGADLRGRRILHAGEGRAEAALMRHAATRMGFHLHVAETPDDALALALALRPDALVMDLGRAPVAWLSLKARLDADPAVRGLPVLALASTTGDRAGGAGFDACLSRPLDLDALGAALETVLRVGPRCGALDADASGGA